MAHDIKTIVLQNGEKVAYHYNSTEDLYIVHKTPFGRKGSYSPSEFEYLMTKGLTKYALKSQSN